MADTNNTTSNTTADETNKVSASKPSKRLNTGKVNDEIEKKGVTISGDRPDQININPIQKESAGEHTAVTNLNMRAQPVHKGHVKVVRAVEAEAKRLGGSAHVVTSHSEGDEKNPIPVEKKVGYLKKIAAPGTRVSATSKAAPSIIDTAARLNQHAHHLVVVAGSDRADEYEKLLHKYNGKPDKSGRIPYNFKSITVKKIGRDPDAEGTAGISGTKMREHARNGNIAGFKSGLPPELHQHAEEMMAHINAAGKKKVKESLDDAFESRFIDTEDTLGVLEVIEEAYGKGYKSPWDKIEKVKPGIGKRIDDAAAAVRKSADDYQKILDREAAEKNKKTNEAFEQIDEISDELVGRVNKLRTLGPDIMRGVKPKPHKTKASAETLKRAVNRVRLKSKVGAPPGVTEEKHGLWYNIHKKRERIKHGSGERMRKPGSEGAPTNKDFKSAQEGRVLPDLTQKPIEPQHSKDYAARIKDNKDKRAAADKERSAAKSFAMDMWAKHTRSR